jgi:hypothetical protein
METGAREMGRDTPDMSQVHRSMHVYSQPAYQAFQGIRVRRLPPPH